MLWLLRHNTTFRFCGSAMSASSVPHRASHEDITFDVISVQQCHRALKVKCRQAGLQISIAQTDVASLMYVEEEGLLMGGRLTATLAGGSTLSLHCSLENAQDWSVALLPEERDHEFMLRTKDGELRCGWGPDEW